MEPSTPDTGKARLLMGVCGSISVVAVPHLMLWMRTKLGVGHTRAVLTPMAERLIGRQAIRPFTTEPVLVDWDDVRDDPAPHVTLANWADVILVLPASANALGKFANGIGDDLLSSIMLAASCPKVVVPATNAAMWDNPAVQRNVTQLRADGIDVVEPQQGIEIADGGAEFGSLGDYRPVVIRALAKAMAGRDRPGGAPDDNDNHDRATQHG